MEKPNDDRHLQKYLKAKVSEQKKIITNLRQEMHELKFSNLKMRLDLEVMVERPESIAALKIRHRYNLKRTILQEALDAVKN
jgi:uncharacterized coiled-coil protein SlyX